MIVLKDKRVLHPTPEQLERLNMVILLSTNMNRRIKVGRDIFSLNDIETDPEKILRLTQVEMFDIPHTSVRRKGKVDRLS